MATVPSLVRPDVRFRRSYCEAANELVAEGRATSVAVRADDEAGFAALVQQILDDSDENAVRPPGRVPVTTLWWVEGDEYLGRLSIRHRLTDELRRVGGHIGYDVRPTARRLGHATAMLRAGLFVALSLGIDAALVTCDTDNAGSRRVIEANGGVLEDELDGKLRFWIATSSR